MPRLRKEVHCYTPQGKRKMWGAVKTVQSYLSLKRGIDSPILNVKKIRSISQRVLHHFQVKKVDTWLTLQICTVSWWRGQCVLVLSTKSHSVSHSASPTYTHSHIQCHLHNHIHWYLHAPKIQHNLRTLPHSASHAPPH